jgi:hypothetical protein
MGAHNYSLISREERSGRGGMRRTRGTQERRPAGFVASLTDARVGVDCARAEPRTCRGTMRTTSWRPALDLISMLFEDDTH